MTEPFIQNPTPPRVNTRLWFILLLLPSLGVWFGMGAPSTRGTALGQAIYFLAKCLFYGVPICYFFLQKRPVDIIWPVTRKHLTTGLLWGLVLGFPMLIALATGWQLGIDLSTLKAATTDNGLDHFGKYLFLALYLSFINSFMEEFVWRDFIFQHFRHFMAKWPAVIVTNLAFTAHHFLALQFQVSATYALIGSGAVFLAGCFWSWLYLRYRHLGPAYISHILADLAIFSAGAWIIFQ